MPKLILIRGVPGSGKSTLASKMHDTKEIFIWTEADNYWERPDGTYDFNPKRIGDAHDWCFECTKDWLERDKDVAVANTFTRIKEMRRYIDLASEMDYELRVIRCTGEFENVHNVPEATLQKMKERFEDYEGEEMYNVACRICGKLLNTSDPTSTDCGGDCIQCMAESGDPGVYGPHV